MSSYWISDAKARVLGPISLVALQELISAGRIHGITQASTDGQRWAPIEQFPEIAELQSAHVGEARRVWERREAAQLLSQLEAMRGKPPHEVFNLPVDAGLDVIRAAFFRLVKRFYPDSLPSDAAPELRAARAEVFGFLSGLMASIERQPPPPPAAALAPAPTPSAPPAPKAPARPPPTLKPSGAATIDKAAIFELRRERPAAPSEPRPAAPRARPPAMTPTYEPREFVGLERRSDDRVQVTVEVSVRTCNIFTANKLLNISSGGAFIPCQQALELGTKLDMVFRFDDPSREVKAKGSVVWWNAGDAKSPRGFGVRFNDLTASDRQFIERYVRSAVQRDEPRR